MSLSFSLFSAITSSWDFFLLEEDNSSRAMLASFSLMAASKACCLRGREWEMGKRSNRKYKECYCKLTNVK